MEPYKEIECHSLWNTLVICRVFMKGVLTRRGIEWMVPLEAGDLKQAGSQYANKQSTVGDCAVIDRAYSRAFSL